MKLDNLGGVEEEGALRFIEEAVLSSKSVLFGHARN
jgi:hypothetical protein